MSQDTTNYLGGNISGASSLPQCAWCGMYYQPGTLHVCRPYFPTSTYVPTAPQPWLCPKCSRVYGPFATECRPCNDAVLRGSPSTEEREP